MSNPLKAIDKIKAAHKVVIAGRLETNQQVVDFREASTLLITAMPALMNTTRRCLKFATLLRRNGQLGFADDMELLIIEALGEVEL